LVFDNYYNHTAATFRGVRGQLYSSYQYKGGYQGGIGFGELDIKHQKKMLQTQLVSIVDILKTKCGYNTCYVNPEPGDANIVNYLYSLGVDTLMSGNYGHHKARTDKQIFDVLKNTVRYYKKQKEPFFIVCYNLGTHHGYDSPDLKYGDGSNSYLNKFHNYDAAFGDFVKEMNQEGMFDNTLLVFSADHATYPTPEYKETFASSQSVFINRIPLFMYSNGVIPQKIDAGGRNSLDLAPTLLDILGVHNVDNYFLGTSLFRNDPMPYSRICALGDVFFAIESDGALTELAAGTEWVNRIRQYYEISVIK
jgi:phosphoglycerol transferase MdoB-like AlkP superfamily enzyme